MNAILEQAAAKTAKAKKEDLPTVTAESVVQECTRLIEINQYLKDLTAERDMLKADLILHAEKARLELSQARNAHVPTIQFNGLKYVTKNQYSPIPFDGVALLKAEFGDLYPGYFAEGYEVKFDAARVAKLTDAQHAALVDMGATITKVVKPTVKYHEARSTNENVSAAHNRLGIVKQYNPTLGE